MLQIYRYDSDGNLIRGTGLPAFIHNMDYFQVIIGVYVDGMIDCWGLVDLEGFKQKVKAGWVVTEVPAGGFIKCGDLYHGTPSLTFNIKSEEFVKEVEDTLSQLQGNKTSDFWCRAAFSNYLENPGPENRDKLQAAYDRVPLHNRRYVLGDMDYKDTPIKQVLSGDKINQKEFEYWRKQFV